MEKYQTALTPLVQAMVESFTTMRTEKDQNWKNLIQEGILPMLFTATQDHLKECPRCRFQCKIQLVKPPRRGSGGGECKPVPFSLDDVMSVCEQGIVDVNDVCEQWVCDTLEEKFVDWSEKLSVSRPSSSDSTFASNFSETHRALTIENLRDSNETYHEWIGFLEKKQVMVERINEQDEMIRTLRAYHKDEILPMTRVAKQRHAISNHELYVIENETFIELVDNKVAKQNAALKVELAKWEVDVGKPFEIDGNRWIDLKDRTLEGTDALPNSKKLSASVSPDDSVSAVGESEVMTKRNSTGGTPKKGANTAKAQQDRRKASAGGRAGAAAKPKPGGKPGGGRAAPSKAPTNPNAPYGLAVTQPPLLDRQECAEQFKHMSTGDGDDEAPRMSVLKAQAEEDAKIEVCVRIRPLVSHEKKAGHKAAVKPQPDGNSIHISAIQSGKPRTHSLMFNTVCDGHTKQQELLARTNAKKFVVDAMDGFNCTMFAYGQTGSGKTFSMAGPVDVLGLQANAVLSPSIKLPPIAREVIEEMLASNLKLQGLMPQLAYYLYETIAKMEREDPNVRFFVRATYIEIYNEKVQDLLTREVKSLAVRENMETSSFYVEGLSERECETLPQLLQVFVDGTQNRMVTSHEMNSESSRSHAIMTMKIEKRSFDPEINTVWVKHGKLSLVDLAGSESVKLTKTAGQALQETAGINKSLLSLSNVISTLSEKGTGEQVTFRNSKLTMLLMDSLIGAGSTMMLACCSPSDNYITESLSTLQFATKAANISKTAVTMLTPHELEVQRLKQQIDGLKEENKKMLEAMTEAGVKWPPQ